MLTDYDLHLLGEGKHWKSYDKLGAQLCTIDGKRGVHFALWAPNAQTSFSNIQLERTIYMFDCQTPKQVHESNQSTCSNQMWLGW